MNDLTSQQLQFWQENSFLLLTDLLGEAERQSLSLWADELASWPETPGKWMKYFERSQANERQLCRVENFYPYHEELRKIIDHPRLINVLSQLMGQEATIFKEKINFKLPGGSGFAAHQDAPAFVTFKQSYHITVMVSIDDTTVRNGCLEVVRGWCEKRILRQALDGTLDPQLVTDLHWEPLITKRGDVLIFDSYLPHRSNSNLDVNPRRALYVTYNPLSDGSYREKYFEEKRKIFPPQCERKPGLDYSKANPYNLGNPIE